MYLIKTRGIAKIPDYVQIRDANFVLIEHITLSKIDKYIEESNFKNKEEIKKLIANNPYGEIIKVD